LKSIRVEKAHFAFRAMYAHQRVHPLNLFEGEGDSVVEILLLGAVGGHRHERPQKRLASTNDLGV